MRIEGAGCPSWIHPNADETGYYRWRLPEPQLLALVAAGRERLTAPEEAALPGDLDALLVAAEIDGTTYLKALGYLAHSKQRQVVEAVLEGWHRVYHAAVDYDGGAQAKTFAAYVRHALQVRAQQLGMRPRPGEGADTELLRSQVISAAADLGGDTGLRAEARVLTRRFLADEHAVPPAAAQIAVPIAALEGDATLQDALVAALGRAGSPHTRAILLSGIGGFRDPALFRRSLDLYLTDALRVSDFWAVMGHARETSAQQAVAFAWLSENFDRVAAKLGDDGISSLPFVGAGFCDADGRERLQQFFTVPAHQRPGSARPLAQALEGIDQCIRLRSRATPSVAAFLGASGS